MGTCYSGAASYGAWVCGYGGTSLDDIRYHAEGIDTDQFLSDDELLGLDDEDDARLASRGRREKVSWRGSRGGTGDGTGSGPSEILASPYGNRQLILHNNYFEPSQLSDGLDTTSGSATGVASPNQDYLDGIASGVEVSRGSMAQVAASHTADVMYATQQALSCLPQTTAVASCTQYELPSTYQTRGVAQTAAAMATSTTASSTSYEFSGGLRRLAYSPANIQAAEPSSHGNATAPSSGNGAAPLSASRVHELTSWIDNPDELRSLDFQSTDTVGAEDFDEFLNSVVARSLTGRFSSAAATDTASLPSATPAVVGMETVASPGSALSDGDEEGLVVGASGQIVPARRQSRQHSVTTATATTSSTLLCAGSGGEEEEEEEEVSDGDKSTVVVVAGTNTLSASDNEYDDNTM